VANPEAKTTPAEVAALQNEMRKTFIQVVAGAFALFALYLTYRRVKVAEQGHITDRYTKAIEQLGALTAAVKPNVEVRLGAIYALERIAQDSPRDHWTIMEVLTAYVRQNAPKPEWAPTKTENSIANTEEPATEIQAILTVLGRRRRDRGREHEGLQLDLRSIDLRRANFDGAHLEGANFILANLDRASFYKAHLEGATFNATHLKGASFYGAHLQEASFDLARLEWASFERAHFSGAHVEWPTFFGAQLNGARFVGAVGLSVEQFVSEEGWEQAKFDEAFLRVLRSVKGKNDSPGDALPQPETQESEQHQGGDEADGHMEVPDHPEKRP
jgi:uncharacterized protein YjbI with pentapeptide repeats